tara:strand:- start:4278 stop:5555 length:1278 start_codon:yes stop_codon:yes gene_type:complete
VVRGRVEDRTSATLLWEREESDLERLRSLKSELLADGVTRAEAVQIALYDNRRVQAALEEVGIAKSNLVQSRLLSNPSADALLRFPIDGGRDVLESGLLGFLSDLWIVPIRSSMQEHATAAALRHVESSIVDVATEATQAYDRVLYSQGVAEIASAHLGLAEDTLLRLKVRYSSGVATALEVHEAEAAAASGQVELARAERDLRRGRAKLLAILNLDDARQELHLADGLEAATLPALDLEQALNVALEQRLDLARLEAGIELADWQVTLAKARVFDRVQVGVGQEGVIDGQHELGPMISLELPVFDQNQAQIAKARYRLRQQRKLLQAARVEARFQIASLLAEIAFRDQHLETWDSRESPALEKAVEFAVVHAKRMRLDYLHVLGARANYLNARRTALESRWRLRFALAELERSIRGGGSQIAGG